jgi:hypothetical protein
MTDSVFSKLADERVLYDRLYTFRIIKLSFSAILELEGVVINGIYQDRLPPFDSGGMPAFSRQEEFHFRSNLLIGHDACLVNTQRKSLFLNSAII